MFATNIAKINIANISKDKLLEIAWSGTSARVMMTECNENVISKWKNIYCARSEMLQEKNKKIYWKQFEYRPESKGQHI